MNTEPSAYNESGQPLDLGSSEGLGGLLDKYGRSFHRAKLANGSQGTQRLADEARQALVCFIDAAVAAERERCAKLETAIQEALKQARAYPWASGAFIVILEDALRPNVI